jgi:hypothetical protein
MCFFFDKVARGVGEPVAFLLDQGVHGVAVVGAVVGDEPVLEFGELDVLRSHPASTAESRSTA